MSGGRLPVICVAAALLAPLAPLRAQAVNSGLTVLSIATAADYSTSHTVYAVGQRSQCTTGCTELWRTVDGGATWARAAARGWERSTVLPVVVGRRAALVTAVAGGYALSYDAGETFQHIDAPGSPTAVTEGSAGAVELLLTGKDGSSDYVLGLPAGTTKAIPGDPSLDHLQINPSPAYGHSGANIPAAVAWGVDQAKRSERLDWCDDALVCTPKAAISAGGQVVFSPTFATDETLFLLSPNGLLRSTDGGVTLVPVTVMTSDSSTLITTVTSLAATPDFDTRSGHGTLFAGVVAASKSRSNTVSGGVFRSSDGGLSWQPSNDNAGLSSGVAALTMAPDGRLFAGTIQFGDSPGFVYCSADGGRTWGNSCPPYKSAGTQSAAVRQDSPAGSKNSAPTPSPVSTQAIGGGKTPAEPSALRQVARLQSGFPAGRLAAGIAALLCVLAVITVVTRRKPAQGRR